MVKLTSFVALSTLIIAPTFASELWNIETRDVAEPLFGRETEGLFAREQDFELPNFVRRFCLNWSRAEEKTGMDTLSRRDDALDNEVTSGFTSQQLALHNPFHKHELVSRDFDDDDLLERDLDHELYIRLDMDDDLFERFYDDLSLPIVL